MEGFKEKVIKVVKRIPKGCVTSYGTLAILVGSPGAARQVGFVLRQADLDLLPWWRVVNAKGQISIKGSPVASKDLQKQLLEAEGVAVSPDYQILDFLKLLWRPNIYP